MPQKPKIQVIDRMSNLLDAVARYPEPVSLKILAAETGLHSSTAFRILNSMVDNGFAERDATGKYQLGSMPNRICARSHNPSWRDCETNWARPST
jgi:DNA-binding IclR family transcriptional regulator